MVAQLCAPHLEYVAIRGKGAWRNGVALTVRDERSMAESVVGVSGPPPAPHAAKRATTDAVAITFK